MVGESGGCWRTGFVNSQSYHLFLLFLALLGFAGHAEKRQVCDLMVLPILPVMAVAPAVLFTNSQPPLPGSVMMGEGKEGGKLLLPLVSSSHSIRAAYPTPPRLLGEVEQRWLLSCFWGYRACPSSCHASPTCSNMPTFRCPNA